MENSVHTYRPAAGKPSYITTQDNIRFLVVPAPWRQISEIPEYRFDDIRKSDIVIDIGANVGAFAIRAARVARQVLAVEPVTFGVLRENIRLNDADVRVICGALGNGSPAKVRWDNTVVNVPTFTLRRIIEMAGGCDFLKCDCEGAEWGINHSDLAGVRRVEMELHLPPICDQPNMALLDMISQEYEFTIDRVPCHGPLGLMGYLHAFRKT